MIEIKGLFTVRQFESISEFWQYFNLARMRVEIEGDLEFYYLSILDLLEVLICSHFRDVFVRPRFAVQMSQ